MNMLIGGQVMAHGNHRSITTDAVAGSALPFPGLPLRGLGCGLLVGTPALDAPTTGVSHDVTLGDLRGVAGELPQRARARLTGPSALHVGPGWNNPVTGCLLAVWEPCNGPESVGGVLVTPGHNPGNDNPIRDRTGSIVLEVPGCEGCAGTLPDQGAGFTYPHRCCDLESVAVYGV